MLFETLIGTFAPDRARPLWEHWGRYEHQYDDLEITRKQVFPNSMSPTVPNTQFWGSTPYVPKHLPHNRCNYPQTFTNVLELASLMYRNLNFAPLKSTAFINRRCALRKESGLNRVRSRSPLIDRNTDGSDGGGSGRDSKRGGDGNRGKRVALPSVLH